MLDDLVLVFTCTGVRATPTPGELLRREVKEGREAIAQRALSSLVLGHEPLQWNLPDEMTPRGTTFLHSLDVRAFASPSTPTVLVDELELPSRHAGERAGWPDDAAVGDDRLLMIELKAERGSHTPGQCERYLDLARHHHPQRSVDLVYVTPTMPRKPIAAVPDRARYAHLLWLEVLPLIVEAWGGSDMPEERELTVFLTSYLPSLDRPRRAATVPPQRPEQTPAPAVAPALPPRATSSDVAMEVARQVQGDRRQRPVPTDAAAPDELEAERLELRDRLMSDETTPNVRPWLWRTASTGQPMTEQGRSTGYELRLSYFRSTTTS